MPKVSSPTKSKSYISTSSGSDGDSDSSNSSSSGSEKSKKSVIIRPKSRSPPPQPPAKKEKEVPPPAPPEPTRLQNSNGLRINQRSNLHEEHVAILDKLSGNMREEVKRGLALLNTCVNELAQTKWILVNVERTLDEFYEECPVCRKADDDDFGHGPGNNTTTRLEISAPIVKEESTKDKESRAKHKTGSSHDRNESDDSDGEKKKSHKLIPPMPMGRSGCNFSKHSTSTKFKHKAKKVSTKESTKVKTPESTSSTIIRKEVKSEPTKVPETPVKGNTVPVPGPAKYKAGPRSKTRPSEKPLDEPAVTGSIKSTPLPAKTPSTAEMTDVQLKYLRALIKEGSSVKVSLDDLSFQLNGRTKIEDWRKLDQPEADDAECIVSKTISSSQKSKSYKPVSSDSDEDEALIKLKRKHEEVSEKSSKKHKSNSHSHTHHSKDKYKHSLHGPPSKDKHSKIKSADSIKRDRTSVDSHSRSHSSGKDRKSDDRVPGPKHRKSKDSGSARRDSKGSEHREKDDKSQRRDSESKIRKLSDPGSGDHKSVSEVSVKSTKSTNEPTPKATKSEVLPVVDKVVAQENISSTQPEQVKPTPATLNKVPNAAKEMIFKLLQEKFQKFNESKNQNIQKPPEVEPVTVPVLTSSTVAPSEAETSKNTDRPSTSNSADVDDAKSTRSDSSRASTTEKQRESLVEVSTTEEIEKKTVDAMDVEDSGDNVSNVNTEEGKADSEIITAVSQEAEITSTVARSLVLAQDEAIEIKDNTFQEILQSLEL